LLESKQLMTKLALRLKNMLKFIDGTFKEPLESDLMYLVWERCNLAVVSWLQHSISDSTLSFIACIDKANEVWKDLKDHFSQGDIFKISDSQEDIYKFQQGTQTVTDYFTQLKITWDELDELCPLPQCKCATPCSCQMVKMAETYRNQDHVIRFLKGLNEQYSHVRSQIMLFDPLPSITKVFSLVIQQERQMNVGGNNITLESKVLPTSLEQQLQHNGQGRGRRQGRNQYRNNNDKICSYCGKNNHIVNVCFYKHGFPSCYKSKTRQMRPMKNQITQFKKQMIVEPVLEATQ